MIARITGETSQLEAAKRLAETVLSLPAVIPLYTNMARSALALLAVQRGDVAAGQEQYAALESVRGIMLPYIGTDRLLGLLAHSIGQLDQAAAHFEDALAFCRRAGYRPELAWTCCDYADMLLQRDYSGRGAAGRAPQGRASPAPTLAAPEHRAKAVALLEEALAISRGLGMRPLMERVSQRLERLEPPPSTAPAYPDGLTQREVEVLRLIAAGKTDRQIAEALYISVTTASTHVRNLLNKTNTANRAEAAAYAAQHELI